MFRLSSVRAICIALLLVAGAVPADAQTFLSPPRIRGRIGLVAYGTGDDANCAAGAGLVAGIAARTQGEWFSMVTGDLYLAAPLSCTGMVALIPYGEGRWASEIVGVNLLLAPRMSARIGRELTIAGLQLEPTMGAGLLRASPKSSRSESSWNPWVGGAVAFHRSANTTFEVEAGVHRIPVSHEIHTGEGGWQEVDVPDRPDGIWRPLVQASVRVSLYP